MSAPVPALMLALLSALPALAAALLAGCLYAAIWRAARGLDAAARALARAAPLGAIAPGLLGISLILAPQRDAAVAGPADLARAATLAPGAGADREPAWDVVPVFYGTDRARQEPTGGQ
ncbi:MAG TPA: hypothetical protein VH913_18480, partial [Hyphomicrobiaceae bacterium]